MGRKKRRTTSRAEPERKRGVVGFVGGSDWESMECMGYTSLDQCPEIYTAVNTIAKLIASMTMHLMENTESGDIRVKNELSKKVDISPNKNMTRFSFMYWIVKTLMLDGNGNAVIWPETSGGILRDLKPVPSGLVSLVPNGIWNYQVIISGEEYSPDSVLHFTLNPDSCYPWMGRGQRVVLRDVAHNLKQASKTEKGFMASKWKPSLIVKVDALIEEFSGPKGRKKFLDEYVSSSEAGEPWVIPAEQFEIEQVKPLSLSDLALADFVELDKKTVASIMGVPSFVLGIGDFQREAWNNFINTTVMPIATIIQQEMTKKLLYSPDWFFRFNPRSLYNYDLSDMASVADEQYVRGIMTGNEARDWIGLSPLPGLDELVVLENYIPLDKIGDQKKINGGDGE